MAQIDDATEQRIADSRSRKRQDGKVPFLIRDDGMLYPNTALVREQRSRYRPYHGDVRASLEERLRYLKGLAPVRAVEFTEPEPFDIGKADADALVQFAQEQWGELLDPSKPIAHLRAAVAQLAKLPAPVYGAPTAA
jgi:hypothetical protein